MHILLTNVHLDCRGRVPVKVMLAGMNLSKPGMNLSKPGMNLSKPGKKHHNHVIMRYNGTALYFIGSVVYLIITRTSVSRSVSWTVNYWNVVIIINHDTPVHYMMVEKLKLHRDMNIFWGPGPHLTNAFSSTIQIQYKICFALDEVIATKFCTWHDSCAVVACNLISSN